MICRGNNDNIRYLNKKLFKDGVTMLLRSQNKKQLIDAVDISIRKYFLDKKCGLSARYASGHLFSEINADVGEYPNEEAAMQELDDIMQFFSENPNGVYQIK